MNLERLIRLICKICGKNFQRILKSFLILLICGKKTLRLGDFARLNHSALNKNSARKNTTSSNLITFLKNSVTTLITDIPYFVVYNLKTTIMKGLYILLAAIIFTSCQHQSKEDINKAKQASIDSMKVEINKQRVIDSMKTEMAKIKEEQKVESEKVVVVHQPANGNASTTTTTTKKKGWSATAKGAVIGAGVGAATGAIVSKKKGEGAIIGGLAGAALGTGTGAVIDSKNKKKE